MFEISQDSISISQPVVSKLGGYVKTWGNLWRVAAIFSAITVTVSTVDAAVANADQYIDFGTNQYACKAAAQQANAAATGYQHSYCYETGPGHYSLYLAT